MQEASVSGCSSPSSHQEVERTEKLVVSGVIFGEIHLAGRQAHTLSVFISIYYFIDMPMNLEVDVMSDVYEVHNSSSVVAQ